VSKRHFGFPPIQGLNARCLVLGSMPSRRSLAEQQYYAHPRNAFWPLMGRLLGFDPRMAYPLRAQALVSARIAVWDVVASGHRPGSMDADIDTSTLDTNDFDHFFQRHPGIRAILFNGQTAGKLYRTRVAPGLTVPAPESLHTLPSTSPANARLGLEQKIGAWGSVLTPCLESSDN
jgi:double-stranded uracil-DNA glycosylase